MTTWILDDGPFDLLSRFINVTDLSNWPQGQLFVAEQTAMDAGQSPVRSALLTTNSTPFNVFNIIIGTPAFDIVYNHLRPTASRATANLAEHQAIAWIISERRDGIFVTGDKKAAFLGLAELGRGRVAHPHDLWLHLRDQRLVDQAQFDGLCQTTCRSDQSAVPFRCR